MSGGRRPGAGRPKGSGKFREQTVPMRVPLGFVDALHQLVATYGDVKGSHPHLHNFMKSIDAASSNAYVALNKKDNTVTLDEYKDQLDRSIATAGLRLQQAVDAHNEADANREEGILEALVKMRNLANLIAQ